MLIVKINNGKLVLFGHRVDLFERNTLDRAFFSVLVVEHKIEKQPFLPTTYSSVKIILAQSTTNSNHIHSVLS